MKFQTREWYLILYFWFVFLFEITAINTIITEMIAIAIIPTTIIVANTAVSMPPLLPGDSVSIMSVGSGILDDAMTGGGIVDDVVVGACVTPAVCVSMDENFTADEDVTAMTEVCVMCCDEMILLWELTVLHSSTCWALPLTLPFVYLCKKQKSS